MPRSIWWGYYENQKNGSAKCKLCSNIVANKGNTSNLAYHLKSRHPKKYREAMEEKQNVNETSEENVVEVEVETDDAVETDSTFASEYLSLEIIGTVPQSQASCSSNNSSLISLTPAKTQTSMKQYTTTKKEDERITDAVIYFITTSLQPYSLVENEGFRHLLNVVAPSYKLPSRKIVADRKIPTLYNNTIEILQEKLNSIESASYTTDCWTSTVNTPYISLTVHLVNKNWELDSYCISCKEMSEDHTGENIADELQCLFALWKLELSKATFTTDYGSNIIKAMQLLRMNHLPCFGHSLNTAVDHCFGLEVLSDTLGKIKKIQNTFAHSWKLKRELNARQNDLNMSTKNIPSYTRTRWWSLLKLILVIVEQHLVLISLLGEFSKGKYKTLILSQYEVDLLNGVIETLKPLEEISENLAGEKYVTASIILPVLHKLRQQFEEVDEETQISDSVKNVQIEIMNIIIRTLRSRYILSEGAHLLLCKCTLFDPRFKSDGSLSEDEQNLTNAKALIVAEMSSLQVTIPETSNLKKKTKLSGLAAIFNKEEGTSDEKDPETEFNKYISMPCINVNEDPLLFWKANEIIFPRLSKLAKKYLSVPATSVPSERIFSKGGRIVSDLRSSLTTEHAEQLIVLAANKEIIKKVKNY